MNKLNPMDPRRLTEMEKDVLINGIVFNCQFPGEPRSWAIVDDCKITNIDQVSGVISSLSKKGIIHVAGEGDESHVTVTEVGWKLVALMGF